MKLYIGRHGYAGPHSKDPKTDRDRPLYAEALRTAQLVAEEMVAMDEVPDYILASSLTRAIETADIYGRVFGCCVDIFDDLSPHMPFAHVLEALAEAHDGRRIMLIGHEDNIDPAFTEDLESDDKWPELIRGEVRKVKINRDDLSWKLKWSLKPSDLGRSDHKDDK